MQFLQGDLVSATVAYKRAMVKHPKGHSHVKEAKLAMERLERQIAVETRLADDAMVFAQQERLEAVEAANALRGEGTSSIDSLLASGKRGHDRAIGHKKAASRVRHTPLSHRSKIDPCCRCGVVSYPSLVWSRPYRGTTAGFQQRPSRATAPAAGLPGRLAARPRGAAGIPSLPAA